MVDSRIELLMAFSITCDEGAYLAGEDTAPPPLAYFSAGIAL